MSWFSSNCLGGCSLFRLFLLGRRLCFCFNFCLLSLEAISLITSLLKLHSEIIKVFLELSGALDSNLESRVRSRLDSDDSDVAPGREHIHNLCELGHALRTEALEDEGLMLVQVENILNDAHVLVRWETHANRQQICEVLLLSRVFVSRLSTLLLAS